MWVVSLMNNTIQFCIHANTHVPQLTGLTFHITCGPLYLLYSVIQLGLDINNTKIILYLSLNLGMSHGLVGVLN